MLMIIINILIVFLFLLANLLCILRSADYIKTIDKQEHKLYLIYPLANWLLNKTPFGKLINRKNNVSDLIKALYTTTKPEQWQRLYWCSKISMVLMIVALFSLFSLISQIMNMSSSEVVDGKYLLRPSYGEGSKEVDLNVIMEQADEAKSKDISIRVEERTYTQEELEVIFAKAYQYLERAVLGDNKSSMEVYYKLDFISSIQGTSITVDWQPEDYNLIHSDGTIYNEGIKKDGQDTTVKVVLSYQKQQKEQSMAFRILPKQYSEEEILNRKLKEEIINASEETARDRKLLLPDNIEGYHLTWQGKKKSSGESLLFVGLILAVVAWILGDKDLEKKVKKRKEQMLLDYPELINKFTLLVNAGMTIKQAWNKIVEDYCSNLRLDKNKKRYAYEEMLTTASELKLGLPEYVAYEQYGRRTGLIPYIKFSSLISQNLKKGNKGFTELLMKEAMEAFEERKETAKRLGEEAGTKLLIPMMIMLIMIFLIIMIPAFWAFRM